MERCSVAALVGFADGVKMEVRAKQNIRHAGDAARSFTLHTGWAAQYIDDRRGRRQITGFLLPAEFWNATSELGILAITNCVVDLSDGVKPSEWRMRHLTDIDTMNFVRRHFWATTKLQAIDRLAFYYVYLFDKLTKLDLITDNTAVIPIRQQQIGDFLNMTAIHANRAVKEMDARGYVIRDGLRVTFVDMKALRFMSEP